MLEFSNIVRIDRPRNRHMDQAQLFGVLGKIHDLGLTLISVQRQPLAEE